jgi:flavin reductase (DIM6/NTAB) family NADH-FMN oxidoreductase RutF
MLKMEPTAENRQTSIPAPELKEQLGRALGRIASGVFVTTMERNGVKDGMLATWISQASFDPPMISVAVRNGRPTLHALSEGSSFVVNVLSKDNKDIFKNFAKPDMTSDERFAGIDVLPSNDHGPVFTQSIAFLNCVVKKHLETGDHTLVVAEVVGGAILNEHEPMVHLRKSGFQY